MSDVADWHQVFAQIGSAIVLSPPRTIFEVAEAEQQIREPLPDDLSRLYLVTDRVFDHDGLWYSIWPLERLVANALGPLSPATGLPRDWIAFGDDGTGDPFCVPPEGSPIYHWSMIGRESQRVASRLDEFLIGWIEGSIEV